MKTLFAIDVMPLLYRGHFVFLKNPRKTSSGIVTSALTGFASSLVQILTEYKPTHIALALDPAGQTFRHKMFPEYKAQREKMPEDLAASIPMAIEFAQALRIPMLRIDGYEADDILGTLAHLSAQEEDWTTYIVTPDKDAAQLIAPNVRLFRPGKGNLPPQIFTEEEAREHWHLSSSAQMIDYLGLAGDSADNIPGIPGVGEKTAVSLLQQYGSMEEILAHAAELKGKLAEKVARFAEQARQSRDLATIRTDVPLPVTLADLERKSPDTPSLTQFFRKYELFAIGKRLLGDSFRPDDAKEKSFHTITDTPHQYTNVDSEEKLQSLLEELRTASVWAFDTETTGLDPRHDRLVGISFSTKIHTGWYVQMPHEPEEAKKILLQFAPFFSDQTKVKIGHNAKFDLTILRQYGIEVAPPIKDSMLAHSVLDAADRHGMDHLSRLYLKYNPIPITHLIGEKKKGIPQLNMGELSAADISDYAAEDADITFQLDEVLAQEVKENHCTRALQECEEPLLPVLLDMESDGVKIDPRTLHQYGGELEKELLNLEIKIRDLGGGNFNPASPKQLGEILFEALKLDPKAARTASGQYATGEEILLKIQDRHPIVPLILEYRACSKLKSTYVDKLPGFIDPATGRVHTTFAQALTETGRLSSSDPNLQNIPIRTERGQKIRAAFIPQDNQHLLISADYSQIELRIMAAMSQDEAMIDAFKRGADIHTETACRVYGVMPLFITPEMRSACKMVNFGIIYGISAFGLAQRLNVSRKMAAELIDTYFIQYPGVKRFMEQSIETAREKGYASTLLGRHRPLPDIHSRNATARQAAERNAINTPVQGSAAELIKLAMIRVHTELKRRNLKTKMVLQIHDELLFDTPIEEVEEVKALTREAMVNALDIGVPLEVSIGQGKNWLEAH